MNEEPERGSSDLLDERRAKPAKLREQGIEPFPHEFPERTEIAAVRESHEDIEAGTETSDRYRVAGRLIARRGHGKSSFLDLRDGTGRIQIQARVDELGDAYEGLLSLDIGDIVGVEGVVFASKRGELSIRADAWELLSKSLRPPPEKFHGLEDVETRYRRRELDLIATELYLKRLVVGGIDRVYELGKDFRNEGISHKHNPEFTMLEWYEAYVDYEDVARELESLVSEVAQEVLGTTKIERDGEGIDLAPPWRRVTLGEAIKERTGVDVLEHPTREELAKAMESEADPEEGWGKLVDGLLSKKVEPTLIQPTFVMDYPVELSPFAKRHRADERLVERWEAFCGGIEIANAFTELNDPDEQRRRFESQREETARGDQETQPYDEAFVEALEQGMPPTGGAGLGIDRLVMLLTGAKSLREVVLFPAMRT